MSKLFVFMMVSADGYFEGIDGDIGWHNVNPEFNGFAIKQLHETGSLLFGRTTYQVMAGWWPTERAKTLDPDVSKLMNDMPKVVFSHTLEKADWENTRLVKEDIKEEVEKLKAGSTKDIGIFGSSNLCVSLIELGLVDEIRLIINPVVLGKGTSLFSGLGKPLNLELKDSHTFNSGNVLLRYSLL